MRQGQPVAGLIMLVLGVAGLVLSVVLRLVAHARELDQGPALLLMVLSVVVIGAGTDHDQYPPPEWWPFGDGEHWFGSGDDDGDGDGLDLG